MREKSLIIFDMDGTLIDSIPALAKSVNFALKELGLPNYPENMVATWVGNGAEVLIKRALSGSKDYTEPKEELFLEAKELMLSFYANHLTDGCRLYDGVEETLSYLKERGYKTAIATNKPHDFVDEMLKSFNIDRYFDLSYGAGVVENKKPHPDLLIKICNDLNIEPSSAVMIGDSASDVKSAKSANIDVIALTFGYNQGINLQNLNPTLVCDSFAEVKEYF